MKFALAPTVVAAVAALLLAAPARTSAWLFTYRDANGTPYIQQGDGNTRYCVEIDHAVYQEFEGVRTGNCSVKQYTSNLCSGSASGYSCADWTKQASVSLRGLVVEGCNISGS